MSDLTPQEQVNARTAARKFNAFLPEPALLRAGLLHLRQRVFLAHIEKMVRARNTVHRCPELTLLGSNPRSFLDQPRLTEAERVAC